MRVTSARHARVQLDVLDVDPSGSRCLTGGRFQVMRVSRSFVLAVATVVTGFGVCAIAASVMAVPGLLSANPWLMAGAGSVALVAGLACLSASFSRRDRSGP